MLFGLILHHYSVARELILRYLRHSSRSPFSQPPVLELRPQSALQPQQASKLGAACACSQSASTTNRQTKPQLPDPLDFQHQHRRKDTRAPSTDSWAPSRSVVESPIPRHPAATMFRNNYDNDSVTFSPQGRIFQVEYAAEAVKQGSVVVGIASKTHVVLVAIKRNAEELSSYQKKLFAIDEHVGIAIAGLTSDARVLSNFMKMQCLGHRLTYARDMPVRGLVDMLASKAQTNTQHYGKRPYGVGLLVAGVDEAGPHLFEFQPSGLTEEMQAFAIGARSQMARTYLEKNLDVFPDCGREELIRHGLRALKESLVQDKELTVDNTSVAVVGVGKAADGSHKPEQFKVYDGHDVNAWIESVGDDKEAAGAEEGEGMDVDKS